MGPVSSQETQSIGTLARTHGGQNEMLKAQNSGQDKSHLSGTISEKETTGGIGGTSDALVLHRDFN